MPDDEVEHSPGLVVVEEGGDQEKEIDEESNRQKDRPSFELGTEQPGFEPSEEVVVIVPQL